MAPDGEQNAPGVMTNPWLDCDCVGVVVGVKVGKTKSKSGALTNGEVQYLDAGHQSPKQSIDRILNAISASAGNKQRI